jgi:large subunit ribosomal protein L5
MAADKKEKKKGSSKGGKGYQAGSEGIVPPAIRPRLRTKYDTEVAPALMKEFGITNKMRIPTLKKIVINAGLGRSTQNIKIIDQAMNDIAAITGQKPVPAKSKKAISNFKLRAGLPIGVMVNLRGAQMWEFADRLIALSLPRIRDFRGISDRGFDGRGNFTMGLKDHHVFPEVDFESAESSFGLNITFVTSTDNDEEGRGLLSQLGFPFKKRQAKKAAYRWQRKVRSLNGRKTRQRLGDIVSTMRSLKKRFATQRLRMRRDLRLSDCFQRSLAQP